LNSILINKKKKFLRKIFLNIFIAVFIIICYFYFSELFGSISKPFLENPKFSIQFGFVLLIFTFFSILAGSFHGSITGFLGEYLYQLAYYDTIHLDWCFLIAFWGLLCGIYRYKPLKYKKKKNIILTFAVLLINSLALMVMIILIEKFYHYSNKEVYTIFLGVGLKFLVQSFLSIIFLIPILLVLYDKALATEERHLYYMILTHHPLSMSDHTFYLRFGNTYIYFCSRCSGVVLGGMTTYFFTDLFERIYGIDFNPELAVFLCIILPIPGLIDWGTQRMLLRKSTTESRLFTGFIIGSALHLMSFTYKYYFFMIFLLILYFSILFLLMYLGHRKEMKLLKEELNHNFPPNSELVFINLP
jgi:uncharacterized membrane protein